MVKHFEQYGENLDNLNGDEGSHPPSHTCWRLSSMNLNLQVHNFLFLLCY